MPGGEIDDTYDIAGEAVAPVSLAKVTITDAKVTADLHDATVYANAIAATENAQSFDKIKASGKVTIYQPTPAEILEWKKALMPVHKEMEGRVGKDAIQSAYKAAGFVPV